mgnify:CR=1 FL=1|jgi:hypothetical protein
MILKNQIITNIIIENVNDLYKLKPFLEDGTLRINKSQIARELEVDRRTVDKYINGYTKPETRNCDDCITPFYDTITELLSDKNQQVFYYRKVLWQLFTTELKNQTNLYHYFLPLCLENLLQDFS